MKSKYFNDYLAYLTFNETPLKYFSYFDLACQQGFAYRVIGISLKEGLSRLRFGF